METKLLIGLVALCVLTIAIIVGAIVYSIYAIIVVGARSEPKPKEEYYLIITKSKHRRVRKDENTKQ